jgi:hypothetical protein
MLLFGFFFSNIKAYGVVNPGSPNVVITVGETESEVTVKNGMNCWTTRKAGYIGSFRGRFVLKFNANQKPIKMRYVNCEGVTEVSSEARAFWASKVYRFKYDWKAIGSNLVTQNPTPEYLRYYEEVSFDSDLEYIQNVELNNGTFCYSYGRSTPTPLPTFLTATAIKDLTRTQVAVVTSTRVAMRTQEAAMTRTQAAVETSTRVAMTRTQAVVETSTAIGLITPSVTSTQNALETSTTTPSVTATPTPSVTASTTRTNTATPTSFFYVIGGLNVNQPLLVKITSNMNIQVKNARCWYFYDSHTAGSTALLDKIPVDKAVVFAETQTGVNISKTYYVGRGGVAVTATYTKTVTRTPTIGSSLNLPNNESVSLIKPRIGDICWGKEIGNYRYSIVEITQNLNYTIPIKKGGCVTHGHYTGIQVKNFLAKQGMDYKLVDFPGIPTVTRTPTVTVISELKFDWSSGNSGFLNPTKGVICWGQEIAGRKNHIVEFTKDLPQAVLLKYSFCAFNSRYSVSDIYNYLTRNGRRIDAISKFP